MTAPTLPYPSSAVGEGAAVGHTPPKHHPYRWRLHRAGITNVWFYYDTEFEFSGGRLVLRGTNGAGKSRALEMLLPFLLDADRRKMDATGSSRVRVEDLMRAGGENQPNRLGYLWLELVRDVDDIEAAEGTTGRQYLTIGALVRFSKATAEAKAWYFTTPLRIGHDLMLIDAGRTALSREGLAQAVGADRITESPEVHRERVRTTVFGLTGEAGRERFDGLRQLLHTLRSPDVGNRIEEGNLPRILSDALPPLSEAALIRAGEQLDGLSETRHAQQRLEEAHRHVGGFLDTYRRYSAGVLTEAAGGAREAAAAARQAEVDAAGRRAEHGKLVAEHGQVEADRGELESTEKELAATITGIRASKEYADARDLDERERKVEALGTTADRALAAAGTARRSEAQAIGEADARAGEAADAAASANATLGDARARLRDAGVHGTPPETVAVHRLTAPPATEAVRHDRLADPAPLTRPAPAVLEVTPADLPDAVAQTRRIGDAATQRAAHAGTRLEQARRLDEERRTVEAAEDRAAGAEQRATDAAEEAEQAAADRDGAAVALARAWRAWVEDDVTYRLLDAVDWPATPVGTVLHNVEALTGDAEPDLPAELDHAATGAAAPARDRHTGVLVALTAAAEADAQTCRALGAEQAQLRAAHDPDPPAPGWVRSTPRGGLPLWRAIDFAEHLTDQQRAGLESALLASGLLTAALAGDGSLIAADGQLLLAATGPPAVTPLSDVLTVDPACPLPAGQVRDVLTRIAVGDRAHPTWVATDGAWGNGPLTGRHSAVAARHVGAAARAAARAARLAEIEALLGDLTAAAEARERQRRAVLADREALEAHLRTAPRSQPVLTARALAADADIRARRAATAYREARETASRLRLEWSRALTVHRAACAGFGLPHRADELAVVEGRAREAARRCDVAAGALTALRRCLDAQAAALVRVEQARGEREVAERDAEADWRTWHGEAAEFAAVKDNIGAGAARIRADLRAAEKALRHCSAELSAARQRETEIGNRAAAAAVEARTAREKAVESYEGLVAAAGRLSARLALPGVATAATGQPRLAVALPEITAGSVEAAVRTVLAALDRRGPAVEENGLIRAQQTLERELAGTFDVVATVEGGVRLVEIADAAGRRTIADAALELHRQCEQGRAALSERERRVFTDFVLGGVAEELRRRLAQARALVHAMNASLTSIRTSHGIGVRLRWNLSDAAGVNIARIRDLVTTAADVRSPEHTAELTDLVKARVDEAFATDPTAGYATHLKAALDYRAWHEVEVIITGPEPGRERRISRRAKLSQGETRFVSYVTLFAAVDAYLSGLPDTGRALRLILLDDAFAKVDDPTIGELMGLLVRLDLDFAMTGHALWGCYPQVPALDCYEIRRRDGTAAVTTHLHWDGHTRHLRAAR